MKNNNEHPLEEAFESVHKESEEVESCGQPMNPNEIYTREHDYLVSRLDGSKREISFGPQPGGLVSNNPFASLAQEGYLHAHPEKLGAKKLAEFDAATKGKKLPKRVKSKK